MRDNECAQFLQWALPRLHMRWPGFRKVRTQVCKRIDRRMQQLNIDGVAAYRTHLETDPDEWFRLDALSRITISRFNRDKAMFAFLEQEVLPALVRQAIARHDDCLKVWSVGCGSGEEPYTIALIWAIQLQSRFPEMKLRILGTDVDPNMQRRARQACYRYSSIKNLPEAWRRQAFTKREDIYCLKPDYRRHVQFLKQDVRVEMPADRFDLVLCRNLVFTYFDEVLQRQVLDRMRDVIKTGGALVIGVHESLPQGAKGLRVWSDRLKIYQNDNEVDKPDSVS